jgi:hypothetical protein
MIPCLANDTALLVTVLDDGFLATAGRLIATTERSETAPEQHGQKQPNSAGDHEDHSAGVDVEAALIDRIERVTQDRAGRSYKNADRNSHDGLLFRSVERFVNYRQRVSPQRHREQGVVEVLRVPATHAFVLLRRRTLG